MILFENLSSYKITYRKNEDIFFASAFFSKERENNEFLRKREDLKFLKYVMMFIF